MSIGLDRSGFDRIGWRGLGCSRVGSQFRTALSARLIKARFVKARLLLLPLALMIAVGAWLIMSGSRGGIAGSGTASPSLAAVAAQSSGQPVAHEAAPKIAQQIAPEIAAYDPFTSEAIAPEQPTPLDRLKLYRQSFRRGGLGSNALVSFTLRNGNDYAVKDVAIACAFIRRDGSHLTDRTRLIPGSVERRSRKSFERLHIGFVNVNASKAKCTLVSASRS